jgi:hypothetical protein
MDDAIATMTPEQATNALAAMSAASNPPPPLVPANAQDAKAQLDFLSRDTSWSQALMSGNVAARDQFNKLVEAAAAGDTVGDTLANIQEPEPIFETTMNGQLPSRVVKEVIAGMRDAGLSDAVIEQAMRGDKISRAEMAAAKAFQTMRHGDAAWVKCLISGEWSANREHQLMSIILSSDIADAK